VPKFEKRDRTPTVGKEERVLNSLVHEMHGAKQMENVGKAHAVKLRSDIIFMMRDLSTKEGPDHRVYVDDEHGLEAHLTTTHRTEAADDAFDLLEDEGVLEDVCDLVIDQEKVDLAYVEGRISKKVYKKLFIDVCGERLSVNGLSNHG